MGLLRTLPVITAVGIAAIVLTDMIVDFYDENKELEKENEEDPIVDEIKKIQCELARLHDLKYMNDNRESTGQIDKAILMVDGTEISLAIFNLEKKLKKLLKKK